MHKRGLSLKLVKMLKHLAKPKYMLRHDKGQEILKGGYNVLTKCKSFADAFLNQTCGNSRR